VLNADLTSRNGGTYQWVLGEWAPEIAGELVPCENGYHVCQEDDLLNWLGPVICEAEVGGQVLRAGGKTVARTARIVKVLDTWNERTARLFACDCAEQALPVFESQRPDDDRPRTAIEVARRLFARGEATADELAAAWMAADAAVAAARAAAGAAWDAAWDAAGAAAWMAADAARAATRAAAWAAERRWQTERLMAYLRGEVD
jgi:hypothetical protein